jgi:hypothetical protein
LSPKFITVYKEQKTLKFFKHLFYSQFSSPEPAFDVGCQTEEYHHFDDSETNKSSGFFLSSCLNVSIAAKKNVCFYMLQGFRSEILFHKIDDLLQIFMQRTRFSTYLFIIYYCFERKIGPYTYSDKQLQRIFYSNRVG